MLLLGEVSACFAVAGMERSKQRIGRNVYTRHELQLVVGRVVSGSLALLLVPG